MLIDVRGLRKTYITWRRGSSLREVAAGVFHRRRTEVEALKGITFSIKTGELVGFLGPNGAGKSTTLKILAGVLHPTAGTVTVGDWVPWRQRRRYVATVGAVFGQKSQLIWDIPPLDSFRLNQAIYRVPDRQFDARLERLTGLLEVGQVIRQPARSLSLGERMRCEFIMSMLHSPSVVFLDEPTIGLDALGKEAIHGFIREMNRSGVTFILTTHDLGDIERLAQRVIVINQGLIVFDDQLPALRRWFGTRKKIRLVTEDPLEGLNVPGLTMTGKRSATDADFELDLSVLPVEVFMGRISGVRRVRDISIEEIPIETVIKELYAQGRKP